MGGLPENLEVDHTGILATSSFQLQVSYVGNASQ